MNTGPLLSYAPIEPEPVVVQPALHDTVTLHTWGKCGYGESFMWRKETVEAMPQGYFYQQVDGICALHRANHRKQCSEEPSKCLKGELRTD